MNLLYAISSVLGHSFGPVVKTTSTITSVNRSSMLPALLGLGVGLGIPSLLLPAAPAFAAVTVTMTHSETGATDVTSNLHGEPDKVTKILIHSDGTLVSYTYDAVHSLTGTGDARGNSVTFTMDNIGNRTNDQMKDPGGK